MDSDSALAERPRREVSGRLATNTRYLKARLSRKSVQAKENTDHLVLAFGIGAAIAAVFVILAVCFLDAPISEGLAVLGAEHRAFFRSVTRFGQSEWILIPTVLLAVGTLLADWRSMSRRLTAAWAEVGQLAGFMFISVAGAGIITAFVKCVIGRARPRHAEGILDLKLIAFDYTNLSFPSGHATTVAAAFIALALIARARPVFVGLLAILAVIAAGSRIMLGVHFTSDVLAGLFIGAGFTLFCAQWLGRRRLAFHRCPDGSLVARTVAIRAVFRHGVSRLGCHDVRSQRSPAAKLHTTQ